ncbi:MAG: OmpA family protein [Hyalangium sp.]|uniref:OmpA family protein n=1 Tax=Hyalangium sp. TaxID=2028555 RepID=UPI003899987D
MHRWKQRVWSWAGIAALMAGCAAHVPPSRELVEARAAYQQASTNPTVQKESPRYLTEAWQALLEAERAYDNDNASARARSLAYVALRKAQIAEAHASMVVAERQRAVAAQALQSEQAAQRQRAMAELNAAQQQLAEARRMRDEAAQLAEARRLQAETAQLQAQAQRRQEETERLAREDQQRREAEAQAQQLAQAQAQAQAERQAREEAERRANEAIAGLQRSGVGVREDVRGTVLTLSGSVLFASGQSDLLPSARNRLGDVAEALKQSDNRLTIEGHTDSKGPDEYNEELSLRRAEQVRDFLVAQGVSPDRISVRGMGKDSPVASNATAEGRANNRRVEIVLQRPPAEDNRTGVGGSGQKNGSH